MLQLHASGWAIIEERKKQTSSFDDKYATQCTQHAFLRVIVKISARENYFK